VNTQDIISSGILELYAAGLASEEEQLQVQAWVKQFPEVAAELQDIESGLEDYALANAIAPAAAVKEKLFETINSGPSSIENKNTAPAKVIGIKNYWKWVAAASVALLIGSSAMNVMFYNKYTTADNNLKHSEEQLAIASKQMTDMKEDMEVVHSPFSMPVALKGQDVMPDATAKIFWMQNTKEVMIDASNLPDAPNGMQYQFWAIVDGVPVNGGMIITNDKGKKYRMQKMKSFGKAEFFAISLEKEGGNPTPTKVVSMGKI
jgi:anti-sigma-K factor RskA